MPTWPTKDPQDVADYVNTWSLNGDAISTSTWTFVTQAGLVKDSDSHSTTSATIWLSAGTSALVGVLVNRIVTAGGRTFDSEPIYLPISETYVAPASGYVLPTSAQLVSAFPEFAGVGNIDFWITRAARMVDTTWTEGDYSFAIILYACHLMALAGQGTGPDAGNNAGGMSGFSEIRSGQLTLKRKTSAEIGGNDGSLLTSTAYGRQYYSLLQMNRPRMMSAASAGGSCVSGYAKDFPGPFPYPNW